MTDTDHPDQQTENLHAFLRYLPKRIGAFEKRILRYRFEGWDRAGMLVLASDVRRLAEASGHYDLLETREHLLTLAHLVGEHYANMHAPDPHQTERMFKMLSAVIKSAPPCSDPLPHSHSAPTEMTRENAVQHAGAAAATAGAIPAPGPEDTAPAGDASIETVELEAPVGADTLPNETAEPAALIVPVDSVEPAWIDPVQMIEPAVLIAPVESVEPAALIEPAETIEPAGLAESAETVEPTELVEAAETVEPTASFEAVANTEAAASVEAAAPIEPDEPEEEEATNEVGMRRVYHLNDGNTFANELGHRLESDGYAIEPVADIDELSELLMCLMPQLLLVDASHLTHLTAIGALRRDAQQRSQPQRRIQLVVMAEKDNLETRRAAHRAGADLLVFPPFDIADVSRRLRALHSTIAADKVRVLIVEDNRADALFAQTVLNRAGMQAQVEQDPMRVLDALKSQVPDLVLMDLHMPFANGVEVTMLIREDPLFARLPIVFLSGESDPDSRLEAINAGGDDFLFKPIRPKHLIAAVQERVRRMHPVNKQGTAVGGSDEPI
jgi:DNA-binding response OmpR family regulator